MSIARRLAKIEKAILTQQPVRLLDLDSLSDSELEAHYREERQALLRQAHQPGWSDKLAVFACRWAKHPAPSLKTILDAARADFDTANAER